MDHALAFWDVVIYSWRLALEEVVLGVMPNKELPWGKKEFEGTNSEHLSVKDVIATLQMTEVCDMIQVDVGFKILCIVGVMLSLECSENLHNRGVKIG